MLQKSDVESDEELEENQDDDKEEKERGNVNEEEEGDDEEIEEEDNDNEEEDGGSGDNELDGEEEEQDKEEEEQDRHGKHKKKEKKIQRPSSTLNLSRFYGFKCYFERLIIEGKEIMERFDKTTVGILNETPFGKFFNAINSGRITTKMVDSCSYCILDIIGKYTKVGNGFK
jgi:cobalamin biosynthesis protein CobT